MLDRHPELVEEQAASLLSALIEAEVQVGDDEEADRLSYFLTLLRRCRMLGPQRVLRELTTEEADEVLDLAHQQPLRITGIRAAETSPISTRRSAGWRRRPLGRGPPRPG